MFKLIIGLLLLFMIYNLFRAMFVMLKNEPDKKPMSHYIGRRVMFSALVIVLMLIGLATGLISPNPRPY